MESCLLADTQGRPFSQKQKTDRLLFSELDSLSLSTLPAFVWLPGCKTRRAEKHYVSVSRDALEKAPAPPLPVRPYLFPPGPTCVREEADLRAAALPSVKLSHRDIARPRWPRHRHGERPLRFSGRLWSGGRGVQARTREKPGLGVAAWGGGGPPVLPQDRSAPARSQLALGGVVHVSRFLIFLRALTNTALWIHPPLPWGKCRSPLPRVTATHEVHRPAALLF
jgi:hypothetical protein